MCTDCVHDRCWRRAASAGCGWMAAWKAAAALASCSGSTPTPPSMSCCSPLRCACFPREAVLCSHVSGHCDPSTADGVVLLDVALRFSQQVACSI